MEFHLSNSNQTERLQLPVPPSEFNIQRGHTVTAITINNLGEITSIGKGKLSSIVIESFFPAQYYSFCQYKNFPEPYDCVDLINKWKDSGKPIRLLITDTPVNLPMAIEDFKFGERDGTHDVYFSLSLKEYRYITVSDNSVQASSKSAARPVETATPTTYTVKKGDSLWLIAKRLYGDGSKYSEIAQKNGLKNPSKISVGQVLKL